MIKFLVYIPILMLFLSCGGKESDNQRSEIINVNLTANNSDTNFKIKIRDVIELETSDNSLFSQASRITFFKKRIYILDKDGRNSLFVFDNEGNFINSTKKGNGPGEIIYAHDFYIDTLNEGRISVWDLSSKRKQVYDLDLDFITSETTNENLFFRNLVKLNSGDWLVHNQNNPNRNKDSIYSFLRYSEDFKNIKEKYLPAPFTYNRLHVLESFSREWNNSNVLFCRPYDNTIYTYNEATKKVEEFYKVNFGEYTLKDEELKDLPYADKLLRDGERVKLLGYPINTNNYFACSFNDYKERVDFFIYSKINKTAITSENINLPKGQLKGSIDHRTFVLTVGAEKLAEFVKNEDTSDIFQKVVNLKGNDYIVLFSIGLEI